MSFITRTSYGSNEKNKELDLSCDPDDSSEQHFNCHHSHTNQTEFGRTPSHLTNSSCVNNHRFSQSNQDAHLEINSQNYHLDNRIFHKDGNENDFKKKSKLELRKKELDSIDRDFELALQNPELLNQDFDGIDDHYEDAEEENEDEEDEEDDECNEEECNVDGVHRCIEEIDEDGSYQSDQSTTTSTSTLNNLRNADDKQEKVNCCNCCYCEVFGHGMPSQAPTSRNFNEIRDRLRLRYAKKKECGSTNEHTNVEELTKHHSHASFFDQLNNHSLASKKHSHLNVQNQTKSNESGLKKDERDLDELLRFINDDENAKLEKKNKKKKEKKNPTTKLEDNEKSKDLSSTGGKLDPKNGKAANSSNKNDKVHLDRSNNQEQQTGRSSIDNSELTKLKNEQQETICPNSHNKTNTIIDKKAKQDKSSSAVKQEQQVTKKNSQTNKKVSKSSGKSNRTDNSLNNKRNSNEKASGKKTNNKDNLDDVFLPKDNIDNEEGDEFEKELEEFKRFCFNSVPLPKKEKVNLDLKNIVIKKKTNSNSFNKKN